MSNKQGVTKFDFLLSLENNIVCQRCFNVMDYNPNARRSMELYGIVKNICEDISYDLKNKTLDYLIDNQVLFESPDYVEETNEKNNDNFLLQIKLGDDIITERVFPSHYYHPKVRYTVDIRPKLKRILNDLTYILSSENDELQTKYLNYNLLKK